MVLAGICSGAPKAWAVPPAENILFIYYADTTVQTCDTGSNGVATPPDNYPQAIEAAFVTALTPLASSIQTLQMHNGDNGIAGELASQYPGKTLANWCQVYDLRFLNDCNNITGAGIQADDVTNADMALYRTYLSQGGSLFMQGEHHDFYQRNNGILQFVNTVAVSPVISTICSTSICADVNTGNPYTDLNPFTANYGFNTIYNNLVGAAAITTVFGGGIPIANYGSGLPLITIGSLSTSGTSGGLMMAWLGAGALNAPYSAGKLITSFETNAWATPAYESASANLALQNVYAELAGCVHYTVTKTFATSPLCVGASSSFTICANNTSASAAIVNYSISDTIATCLTYNSSNTSIATSGTGNASAGAAGTLYWWTFPSIAAGSSACVTVNFTAANTTCP